MRKFLFVMLVIAALFFTADQITERMKLENMERDYASIEELCTAVGEVTQVYCHSSWGKDNREDFGFTADVITLEYNEFLKLLNEKLSQDFQPALSNGDMLYVRAHSYNILYEIYAGDPSDGGNMLYPEWHYEKLPLPVAGE